MKTTLFLISTLLLALSPPTLSNHNGGENTRFGRQDQPDLESAVVDVDDEKSVLEMAEVRFWLLLFKFYTKTFFSGYAATRSKARPRLRPQCPHSCFPVPTGDKHPTDHPLPFGICGKDNLFCIY